MSQKAAAQKSQAVSPVAFNKGELTHTCSSNNMMKHRQGVLHQCSAFLVTSPIPMLNCCSHAGACILEGLTPAGL